MTVVNDKWLKETMMTVPKSTHMSYDPRCLQFACLEIRVPYCFEFVLHPVDLMPDLSVIMPDITIGLTQFGSIGYMDPCPYGADRRTMNTIRKTGWLTIARPSGSDELSMLLSGRKASLR